MSISPSIARSIQPYARAFAIVAVLAGSFALVLPIEAFLRFLGRPPSHRTQLCFCRLMCGIIGIRIHGNDFPVEGKSTLIAANHVSWTDIIVLASINPMIFLAKSEVATWPLLGLLARSKGTIFVKRGDRRQISSINTKIVEALRDGATIVLFPEGTSTHGVMKPRFHSSHFEAAQLGNIGVTPVGIFYADESGQADVGWYGDMNFLPHFWALLKKGGIDCYILFGDEISAEDTSRKRLASAAQEQAHNLLLKARDRHNSKIGPSRE